ncbi:hypothetical protein BBJ28_00025775 [Nothophytophthora sp. Chile5]|nr:hypothetical protein BBJ28_00025775 [Nothophytophthora sp. Chile5]
MRLPVSRLCVLPGLALAFGAQQAHASTCKTLLNNNIPLMDALAEWSDLDLSNFPSATVYQELNKALPWFSKCAAAIDPMAVYTSLGTSTSLQSCLKTLNNANFVFDTPEGRTAACSLTKDTLKPCLTNAMTEIVMDAFASTGGCCDDFLAEVTTLVGDSLDLMVEKLLALTGNVLCAKRKFTNLEGTSTTEVCGYSIFHSFYYIGNTEDTTSSMWDLLNLVELPNNQMCKAFAGKAFTNTKGEKNTLGFGTDYDSMGICLQPVDAFLQYLASWPIFAQTFDAGGTTFTMKDMFTTGKSLNGSLLVSWAALSGNVPMIFARMEDRVMTAMGVEGSGTGISSTNLADTFLGALDSDDVNSYANDILMHIPNNGGCTYSDQTISLPYTVSTATGSTTTAAPTATTTTKTASAASMASFSMLIVAGVAMISSLLL